MTALPEAFTERMSRQLGEELPDFLRALAGRPVRGIRMNPEKPFEGMEAYTGGERIPWTETGYVLPEESTAGATVFHEAGAFYLQEPAAMLPAEVMDARPGEILLDLCAAPGGKSTQMGLKLKGEGLLVCNEPIRKRAQILSRNIERMGITNSIVTSCFPDKIPESWNGMFDGVLVDAPCSGEGMFRRDPETRKEWTAEQAAGCAKRQREILREAARLVRPGGRLVYSTCTYNPEENEEIVGWFTREFPEFRTEPFRVPGADGEKGYYLCLPHRDIGEGQFTALMRRTGTGERPRMNRPFPLPDREELRLFREQFPWLPEPDGRFGNLLVRTGECPDLRGVPVLRAGLHLAEARGKILIPDHAAALGGRIDNDAPVTELGREDAARYLSGLSVEGDAGGWTVLRYRGLPLGWGKGSGGQIKNHYPKGLRKERILTEP